MSVLALTFFIMLLCVGSLRSAIGSIVVDERSAFLIGSVLQSLFVFILPSWLAAFLCSRNAGRYLGTSGHVRIIQLAGVILLIIVSMPALNALVNWNANVTLPDSMSELYRTLRDWEQAAAETTSMLLSDTSVWGLVSGIMVIGLLTGFAEECFFRAGLQKALTASDVNPHLSVWVTALIFSAVHFQFFGFFPRLILGAAFGYIYLSSKSLWVNSFAHALNNSVVVVTAWLTGRGYLSIDIESIGVSGSGTWLLVSASVVLTLLFIMYLWKPMLKANCTDLTKR